MKKYLDKTFDRCVDLLEGIAKHTGLTYKQLNVILFCAAWPVATLWLMYKAFKR